MLKLKLQYFGHLIWGNGSLEKTLMLGKIGGGRKGDDRGWDGWMTSMTQWTWVWVNSRIWWWTGRSGVLQSLGSQKIGHDWATDWTDGWKKLTYKEFLTISLPNSDRLYFLGLQITADGNCSHEIKRHLFLGRKAMANLASIFKSRDITLLTKVQTVKAMVYPVVMYRCETGP